MSNRLTAPALFLSCALAVGGYAQEKPATKAEQGTAKPAAAQAAGDAKARARQVIDAARGAKGGAEKLRAVRDLTVRADASVNVQGQNLDVSLTSYTQAPDKSRGEINIPAMGATIVQVISEATAWMDMPGQGVSDMPGPVADYGRQNLAREWFVNFLTAPDGKEPEVTALADAEVNGKPADVLEVTVGGTRFTAYFDKQTRLPLKTAYEGMDPMMETVKAESLYDDYREVGGVKLAHKVTILHNGAKFLESKMTEAKLNAGVEASKFTRQ